jgi:transposase-like protein
MSKRTRRRHTAEQKAEDLRRHHIKKEEVSAICEDMKLNPSLFYV